ncbi:MAG: hypothetical protein NVSMB19_09940 [Vulcanimicrobiaceae bacterium]
MAILNVHYALGTILVLASLAAIVWAPARRYILYLLVLQIVIGAAVWGVTKLPPPPQHWLLAILNGGTYAMATAFERRSRPRELVLGMLALGFVIFAYVYYVGMHALKAMGPAA